MDTSEELRDYIEAELTFGENDPRKLFEACVKVEPGSIITCYSLNGTVHLKLALKGPPSTELAEGISEANAEASTVYTECCPVSKLKIEMDSEKPLYLYAIFESNDPGIACRLDPKLEAGDISAYCNGTVFIKKQWNRNAQKSILEEFGRNAIKKVSVFYFGTELTPNVTADDLNTAISDRCSKNIATAAEAVIEGQQDKLNHEAISPKVHADKAPKEAKTRQYPVPRELQEAIDACLDEADSMDDLVSRVAIKLGFTPDSVNVLVTAIQIAPKYNYSAKAIIKALKGTYGVEKKTIDNLTNECRDKVQTTRPLASLLTAFVNCKDRVGNTTVEMHEAPENPEEKSHVEKPVVAESSDTKEVILPLINYKMTFPNNADKNDVIREFLKKIGAEDFMINQAMSGIMSGKKGDELKKLIPLDLRMPLGKNLNTFCDANGKERVSFINFVEALVDFCV